LLLEAQPSAKAMRSGLHAALVAGSGVACSSAWPELPSPLVALARMSAALVGPLVPGSVVVVVLVFQGS
jgi:hypothetical protein